MAVVACEGPAGPAGPPGDPGEDGTDGTDGSDGTWLTGPGLQVTLANPAIAADGTATVDVKITDGAGVGLDQAGLLTAGPVNIGFVIARLPRDGNGNALQYTSYLTNAANQATGQFVADNLVKLEGRGEYRYTFSVPIDVADTSETHTIGVYSRRTFEGTLYGDDDVAHFVPSGAAVAYTRNIVDNAACASCHDDLALHGGSRKSVELCIMCHSPQTVDPDTGNTVDMKVMTHKIHMGEHLPSVVAGGDYEIIGHQGSVHNYNHVAFPRPVQLCETCHTGDQWKTNPTIATCTSCHDDVVASFTEIQTGLEMHVGQTDDQCTTCHKADPPGLYPISVAHAPAGWDETLKPTVEIVSVTGGSPGSTPTITFRVSVNGAPVDILATPLYSLRATFAGPNTDYARYWQATIQGSGAGGTLVAGSQAGEFVWTAPATAAVPADATGSYSVALENVNRVDNVSYAGLVAIAPFAVTDATAVPRRQVIAAETCNGCHGALAFHGGSRTNPEYCVMCHNPTNVNEERAPRLEGEDVYVHTVQFANMIHRMHMGEELSQEYVIGGYPGPSTTNPNGTQHDFGTLRYPSNRDNCTMCHVGDSYTLPLDGPRLPAFDQVYTCLEEPALDTDSLCDPFSSTTPAGNMFVPVETYTYQAATAACTGCHDAPGVVAHALVMTTTTGIESCDTCHGPGSAYERHAAP